MAVEGKAVRGDTSPADSSAVCPVCYEAFSEERCVHCERCAKLFHRKCVGRWGSSCPMCRDDGQFCDLACEFRVLESLPSIGDSLDSLSSLEDSVEIDDREHTNSYLATSPRGVDVSRLLPIGFASVH